MSQSEAEKGRDLFTPDEQDKVIESIAQPLEDDRPISLIDTGIAPEGRKKTPWYQNSFFQGVAIFSFFGSCGFLFHSCTVGANSKPKIVVAGDAQQVTELKQTLKDKDSVNEGQVRANADLTQEAQFNSIPVEGQQNPDKNQGTLVANQQTGKPGQPGQAPKSNVPIPASPRSAPPRPTVARRPVSRTNTVRMSQRPRYTPPPRVYRPPSTPKPVTTAKPSGPTFKECADFALSGLDAPACSKHGIKVKKEQPTAPVTLAQAPTPTVPKPIKPINLTPYKPPTVTAYRPSAARKPSRPKTNFLAGEIQTMDQYEQEMKGSSSTAQQSAPTVSKMSAKVVRHVEWRSEEEARKLIIPLKITSGPLKGQAAVAKITSLAGTQFTAEITKLGGQTVQPGQYVIEQKDTTYLLAQNKTQGGTSFGKQILGAALAVGGEVASDELGGVRGGNHISGLVPRNQQRGPTGQYWKFSGNVDIVGQS